MSPTRKGSRLTSRGSILNDAKDEFEVDGAAAVFSTWRAEREDPLDVGDLDITEGIYASRQDGTGSSDDLCQGTQILAALPGGTEFLLISVSPGES